MLHPLAVALSVTVPNGAASLELLIRFKHVPISNVVLAVCCLLFVAGEDLVSDGSRWIIVSVG